MSEPQDTNEAAGGRSDSTAVLGRVPTPYQQRAIAQGRAWINGEAKHNMLDDECCPDFSCCEPQLFTADRAERVRTFNSWADRNGWPKFWDA